MVEIEESLNDIYEMPTGELEHNERGKDRNGNLSKF